MDEPVHDAFVVGFSDDDDVAAPVERGFDDGAEFVGVVLVGGVGLYEVEFDSVVAVGAAPGGGDFVGGGYEEAPKIGRASCRERV